MHKETEENKYVKIKGAVNRIYNFLNRKKRMIVLFHLSKFRYKGQNAQVNDPTMEPINYQTQPLDYVNCCNNGYSQIMHALLSASAFSN